MPQKQFAAEVALRLTVRRHDIGNAAFGFLIEKQLDLLNRNGEVLLKRDGCEQIIVVGPANAVEVEPPAGGNRLNLVGKPAQQHQPQQLSAARPGGADQQNVLFLPAAGLFHRHLQVQCKIGYLMLAHRAVVASVDDGGCAEGEIVGVGKVETYFVEHGVFEHAAVPDTVEQRCQMIVKHGAQLSISRKIEQEVGTQPFENGICQRYQFAGSQFAVGMGDALA